MLTKPTKGISRSVHAHNVDLDVFCDWIEGSLLFQDEPELSAPGIIDFLIEGQIYVHLYVHQEFAWQILENSWTELRRRQRLLGTGYPLNVDDRRLQRTGEWRDFAPLSFCLILSYAKWYKEWVRQFGKNFNEQGELFERLSKESLERLIPGWAVHETGWARSHTRALAQVVAEVTRILDERTGSAEGWTKKLAKDAGLDLECYRPFQDARPGLPVYFFQCASGGDWDGKLHTPHLRIWDKLVDFAASPKKAFVTPFSWRNPSLRINCNHVDGFVLDRFRILKPGLEVRNWISEDLRTRLIQWLEPRVARLPWADD